ncbi:Clp amino terminal domain-containing protein, pathogenicity island component [Bradyrhizobium lablabi]|uniref:Clp amino terminal domain-containing protein, pathogenicity island component n=1 Tax=Bradyrhizobium lablabi TaxID=722472 RepID=A0A1M7AGH4_9BRAD|nr:Clp amino terminal domain-containing protein, pathogenicity island component [Bradyrhizobium lablabi]
MRDFRNAKAMAQTLRAALAAKDLKITINHSLELVAEMFGVADWNTLAAKISHGERPMAREKVSSLPLPTVASNSVPPLSATLEATPDRALVFATERRHEYTTLEHLLLALIDDADASAMMSVCNADLGALTEELLDYLDNELKRLVIDNGGNPKLTAGFQRVAVSPIKSAAFSAIISTQALMWAETRSGMAEASTTRSASTPRTRNSGSSGAASSDPIRQVPAG